MCLIFHRNVRCKVFRSLTHFDAVLGFGGNTHCLPIRVDRFRNLVLVKRATVLGKLYGFLENYSSSCFQQTFESLLKTLIKNKKLPGC